tara:strand:- start:729 stop:1139 length:411 start_codon:yes stop_codon:yes gene_type:complete
MNVKHIPLNAFLKIIKKKKLGYKFYSLLLKGMEIEEIINKKRVFRILFINSRGEICVENEKNSYSKGYKFFDLNIIYKDGYFINLFNIRTNSISKTIIFPTLKSAEIFSKKFNNLVEDYLSYNTEVKVDYRYFKLT